MGCCSSQSANEDNNQTQTVTSGDLDSNHVAIANEPESVTPFFTLISDDSCMHCISFLNPLDFVNVCCTCKNFQSLTSLSNRSTQQYWKQQCISLCHDTLSAVQHNNFDTQDWFGLFMELRNFIVHHQGSTLLKLYTDNCNVGDKNTVLPLTLIDFSDGYIGTHPPIGYVFMIK